jgi:pimeloyl-ACP methyl ester carboxylesterase
MASGLGAIAFDQRGHGDSQGPMDGRALADVTAMAAVLRERLGDPEAPIALRGSSMGGYLALVAAAPARARAVVAICPASADGLRRGLTEGRFGFEADTPALDVFLAEHDEREAIAALEAPVLLLHAEGDEQVPVEHSRELAQLTRSARSRLIAVPGGHHRSVQHDPELRAVSVRFIERCLAPAPE